MAGYLLFIPGGSPNAQPRDLLAGVGLGYLCDDDTPDAIPVSVGPTGAGGVMLAWCTAIGAPRLGYLPDNQEWHAMADRTWWFGHEKGQTVTPDSVSRRRLFTSLTAMLADGNEWRIPIARELPRTWGLDPSGRFQRNVQPQFQGFIELSERVYDRLLGAGELSIDAANGVPIPEAWEFICRALSMNYRLAPEMIAALKLVDDGNFTRILLATADVNTINGMLGYGVTAPAEQVATSSPAAPAFTADDELEPEGIGS